MLMQKEGRYNDLSPALRTELEDRVNSFGKTVRYKFDISNQNPDPDKVNGKLLWPNIYTLDPAVFNIIDQQEDNKIKGRENAQKSKMVGMVDGFDDKGNPNKFRKIKVNARDKGILTLHPQDIPEHFDMAMFMELHPKLTGGKFADKTKKQMITRIDEMELATTQRAERTARKKAQDAAEGMTDKEVVEFADAMQWDSTEDVIILRNKAEELAVTNHEFFNDIVSNKKVQYLALVKQAMDRGIITHDPAENAMFWTSNKQKITVLGNVDGRNGIEQFAEWLTIGGTAASDVHKKLESLTKSSKKLVEA